MKYLLLILIFTRLLGHSQTGSSTLDCYHKVVFKERYALLGEQLTLGDTINLYKTASGAEINIVTLVPQLHASHGNPLFSLVVDSAFQPVLLPSTIESNLLRRKFSISKVDLVLIKIASYGVENMSLRFCKKDSVYLAKNSRVFQQNTKLELFFNDRRGVFPNYAKNKYRTQKVILYSYSSTTQILTKHIFKFRGHALITYETRDSFKVMNLGIPYHRFKKIREHYPGGTH